MPLATTGAGQSKGGPSFPIEINFDGDEATYFDGGWSEVGGNTLNDQIVLGAELVTNGDFANWAGDNPTNWTVTGEVGADPEVSEVGAGQGHGGAGNGLANFFNSAGNNDPSLTQIALTVGDWCKLSLDVDTVVAQAIRIGDAGSGLAFITYTTTGIKVQSGRVLNTTIFVSALGNGTDVTIDDISIKKQTLTSLLNPLKSQFGLADGFFIDVHINAVTANNVIGIIWNLDDVVTPTNFSMAYMDGTNLIVDKNVNGTYSNLASVAQAVTPDQILRIENPAGTNVITVKYNGVSKATPTISDAGIISNIGMALFSTEANNAISKVVIGKL